MCAAASQEQQENWLMPLLCQEQPQAPAFLSALSHHIDMIPVYQAACS
jgi:hypothetical protein